MQVSMVDEYNKQLSKVIISTKNRYNLKNLHWVQVSEKIVLAPFDNYPLVLDATHLSEQNTEGTDGLQDTHRSMLEVLFKIITKVIIVKILWESWRKVLAVRGKNNKCTEFSLKF